MYVMINDCDPPFKYNGDNTDNSCRKGHLHLEDNSYLLTNTRMLCLDVAFVKLD